MADVIPHPDHDLHRRFFEAFSSIAEAKAAPFGTRLGLVRGLVDSVNARSGLSVEAAISQAHDIIAIYDRS